MQKTFCDRCGKYIDKQWKKKYAFLKRDKELIIPSIYCFVNGGSSTHMEFCEDCEKAFDTWMKEV